MRNRVSDVFGPAADCPSDEDLLKRSDAFGKAAGTELRERHVATCPYCIARVELFRSFESGKLAAEEQHAVGAIVAGLRRNSPARPQPWWSRLWRPRILAPAALILAAASVLTVINLNPRGRSLDAPVDTVMRSAAVVPVAPLGELQNVPEELRWQPAAGANGYEVRLVEVDRTELWRAHTQSASVTIPTPVRARIVPLKKLLWEVTAVDAAGNSLASSGLRPFVVRK